MATLDPAAGLLTLINTFTVDPDRAEELLELLSKATEETMRHQPGFVSASFHISEDRKHLANYAQWRSKADFEAMLKNPEAQHHMKQAAAIAQAFQPILYTLRQSHTAAERQGRVTEQ